jgi:hypothetical protein
MDLGGWLPADELDEVRLVGGWLASHSMDVAVLELAAGVAPGRVEAFVDRALRREKQRQ